MQESNQNCVDVTELLASDSYIAVNRLLIRELGLEEAVMLAELLDERKYWRNTNRLNDGWFFSTQKNIEERVGLSKHKQLRAIDNLESRGLIKTEVRGMPARRHIAISDNRIVQLFKNWTTSCRKIEQPVVQKSDSKNTNNKNTNKNNNKVEVQRTYDVFIEKFGKNPNQYKLTDKRRKLIARRLNDAGVEIVLKAIENTASNSFYTGDNDRGWSADLDFILRSYEQVERLSQLKPRQTTKNDDDFDLAKYLINK